MKYTIELQTPFQILQAIFKKRLISTSFQLFEKLQKKGKGGACRKFIFFLCLFMPYEHKASSFGHEELNSN